MLWGRTVTSSPSFVFSKTFTSTIYPGKRKTKKTALVLCTESNLVWARQRSEASNSSTRNYRKVKTREAVFHTPHHHPQRPSRHANTRTHLCDIILLPSPSKGFQSKESCRMALETREKRGQRTLPKSYPMTQLSFPGQLPFALRQRKKHEVLPQKPQFPLAPGS